MLYYLINLFIHLIKVINEMCHVLAKRQSIIYFIHKMFSIKLNFQIRPSKRCNNLS